MTGDDHASGGTAGRFDQLQRREPGRLLGRRLGVRARHLLHLSRTRRSPTRQAAAYDAAGLRGRRCTSTPTARNFTPASLDQALRRPAGATSRRDVPERAGADAPTAPTASPGATGRSQPKVELDHGIRLDTNYYYWPPELGRRTARAVHRLGHADALRRPRRHDDRRLPGGDADDRRVGPDLPVHDRHAARPGARPARATTAPSSPTCTPTAPARVGLGRDRRLGAGARRAGRLGAPDARLARRPQRLLVRRHRLERQRRSPSRSRSAPGANGLRAMVPTSSEAGRAHRRHPRRQPGRDHRPRRSRASSTRSSKRVPGDYEATYDVDETGPAISDVAAHRRR